MPAVSTLPGIPTLPPAVSTLPGIPTLPPLPVIPTAREVPPIHMVKTPPGKKLKLDTGNSNSQIQKGKLSDSLKHPLLILLSSIPK